MRKIVWAILLVVAPLSAKASAAWIDAGAPVYFMDYAKGNFLFRGHAPLVNGAPTPQFDYPDLAADLQAAAPKKHPLPAKFYLVDISLLELQNSCSDPNDDRGRLQVEFQYFADHPQKGAFHNWQTDGILIDATSSTITPPFQQYLVKNLDAWLPDKLAARVEQLHDWLLHGIKGVKLPVVLYIHCVGGCDRTGEMAGAYSLRWLKMSWAQMNATNKQDCYGGAQAFGCGNYYATHWYCYYLNAKYGMKLDCPASFPCNGPPTCGQNACPRAQP